LISAGFLPKTEVSHPFGIANATSKRFDLVKKVRVALFKYSFNLPQFNRRLLKIDHRCPERARSFVIFMKYHKNHL